MSTVDGVQAPHVLATPRPADRRRSRSTSRPPSGPGSGRATCAARPTTLASGLVVGNLYEQAEGLRRRRPRAPPRCGRTSPACGTCRSTRRAGRRCGSATSPRSRVAAEPAVDHPRPGDAQRRRRRGRSAAGARPSSPTSATAAKRADAARDAPAGAERRRWTARSDARRARHRARWRVLLGSSSWSRPPPGAGGRRRWCCSACPAGRCRGGARRTRSSAASGRPGPLLGLFAAAIADAPGRGLGLLAPRRRAAARSAAPLGAACRGRHVPGVAPVLRASALVAARGRCRPPSSVTAPARRSCSPSRSRSSAGLVTQLPSSSLCLVPALCGRPEGSRADR